MRFLQGPALRARPLLHGAHELCEPSDLLEGWVAYRSVGSDKKIVLYEGKEGTVEETLPVKH